MFSGRVDTAAVAPDLLNFTPTYTGTQGRLLAAHDPVHGLVGTIAWRAYDQRFAQLDFAGRRVVEVVRLFVAPECRRQGIADALFLALREQAREQGIEVLYLHTHPFLPGAEAFWQRHGFQVLAGMQTLTGRPSTWNVGSESRRTPGRLPAPIIAAPVQESRPPMARRGETGSPVTSGLCLDIPAQPPLL